MRRGEEKGGDSGAVGESRLYQRHSDNIWESNSAAKGSNVSVGVGEVGDGISEGAGHRHRIILITQQHNKTVWLHGSEKYAHKHNTLFQQAYGMDDGFLRRLWERGGVSCFILCWTDRFACGFECAVLFS